MYALHCLALSVECVSFERVSIKMMREGIHQTGNMIWHTARWQYTCYWYTHMPSLSTFLSHIQLCFLYPLYLWWCILLHVSSFACTILLGYKVVSKWIFHVRQLRWWFTIAT